MSNRIPVDLLGIESQSEKPCQSQSFSRCADCGLNSLCFSWAAIGTVPALAIDTVKTGFRGIRGPSINREPAAMPTSAEQSVTISLYLVKRRNPLRHSSAPQHFEQTTSNLTTPVQVLEDHRNSDSRICLGSFQRNQHAAFECGAGGVQFSIFLREFSARTPTRRVFRA